ncbi:hypothetical protein M501DRAFT_987407 [Patellaria atrata CBS 101060]|uniref:Uncharacterized protein n=1 Tax=Patellaria atrata CBS 101060 TaxID=1346257 RepID=A0A9P4VM36_9PEZI|nr:hypothetical protein M501DRAFT_987407 [Patellaria atrata CBS 101060]
MTTSDAPPSSATTDTQTTKPTTFPHLTTTSAASIPSIATSTPALNPEPIELDSSPVSKPTNPNGSRLTSPDEDFEVLREFGGDEGLGVREKRAALLSARSLDPAVVVDIPDVPAAAELAFADAEARDGKARAFKGDSGTAGAATSATGLEGVV